MNQSNTNRPPPPDGDSRYNNGGDGVYNNHGQAAGGGGRRRPHSEVFNAQQHHDNYHNNEYNESQYAVNNGGGRSGNNNWGQSNNFRGGGRGHHQRGGGRQYSQKSSSSDPYYNNQEPLPPDQRKTLVLANVPPHVKHFHIKSHFDMNWGIRVNYAHVDKQSGLAYVRFESVDDAKRVWAVGTNGLDGPNYQNGGGGGEHMKSSSFLADGIVLQEVYPTNFVPNDNTKKYNDEMQTSPMASRKHGRGSDDYNSREHNGGGGSHSNHYSDERESKMARRHSAQSYPTQQSQGGNNLKPPASSSYTTNSSNNSYNRKEKQHPSKQITPEELELKKQKQQEYQKQYEAFQKLEQEWRTRRNAEYQAFATAKEERTSQISTLQHKKELQSKQESMLAKQLPLHKKMLSMLKAKNASASEQSKKMKEILNAQTQLLQLKKDMKQTVEELERLKEEERVKGVFVPSEKRPVFVASSDAGGAQKRSLDRRSTILKVEGFTTVDEVNGEMFKAELKEHFAAFGTVSNLTLEMDGDAVLFALVYFSNRLDAEKAKENGLKFKETSLQCTWYHESSSSTPGDDNDAGVDEGVSVGGGMGELNHDNDELSEVEESYGDYFAGEGLPAGEEHEMVDYEYGDDDDMVDYD